MTVYNGRTDLLLIPFLSIKRGKNLNLSRIMTSLGNIELIKKDIFNSGVAFELNRASDVDDTIDFENGWQAEIRVGIQYLVVRGVLAELTYEEVYTVSYNYAQKFLDLLSVCKITKINLKNHTSSFLIWWRNKDGQNLQVRDILRGGSTVQITAYDENGRDIFTNLIKLSSKLSLFSIVQRV